MGSDVPGVNVSVLRGSVVAEPLHRELPSGSVAVQFDLAVPVESGTHRVPLSWVDPPGRELDALQAGTDVLVVGEVRRRFFRVGGATQSRTEVIVGTLVPARRRAAVGRALGDAMTRLEVR